jgi:PKD repeat protein
VPAQKPTACFNYSPTIDLKAGDSIKFENCSSNSNYFEWSFSDDTYSQEKVPYHIFVKSGKYSVTLKAINGGSVDIISKTIVVTDIKVPAQKPTACFNYSPAIDLKVGDSIKFENCSSNSNYFEWSFSDDTYSQEKVPYHIFEKSGKYSVRLKAINGDSIDTILKTIVVEDKNYTNLHDTIIRQVFSAYDYKLCAIDIDKDNSIDITFKVTYSHRSMNGSSQSIEIIPSNGYQIDTINYIDTLWEDRGNGRIYSYPIVIMPRIYNNGDTVSNDNNTFFDNSVVIAENSANGGYYERSPIIREKWINIGDRYLIVRKKSTEGFLYCWIKIRPLSSSTLEIRSYSYLQNVDKMIINDMF